ncbi:MAG: glycosyltransferase family 4 protein [Bacteroidota bacterium]
MKTADSQIPRRTIAFISLYTEMGGGEFSLYYILKYLDKQRYRPILIVNRDGPLVERVKSLGIEIFRIPFSVVMLKELIRPKNFAQNFRAAIALKKLLAAEHVDIIQCGDVLSFLILLPALLTRPRSVVFSVIFYYEKLRAWLLNLLALVFTAKIVTNSKSVSDDLLLHTIGLRRKNTVIYIGVETAEFYPRSPAEKKVLRKKLSLPEDKIIVGFIGRYELWKGHLTFLDAAKQLLAKRNDLLFLIVGGAMTENVIPAITQYRKTVLEKAASFKQGKELIIMDHRNDIPEIMGSLDVFVCPSDREPMGIVVLEAYACGIPVVASRSVGALEIFPPDKRIFIAEPNDPGSFAGKIEVAIAFAAQEISQADTERKNIASLLSRYSWLEHAKAFERVYDGV